MSQSQSSNVPAGANAPASQSTSHPTYQARYNGLVAVFVLTIIFTALFIAGTSTGFNTYQNGQQYITASFFTTVNTNNGAEASQRTVSACADLQALIEAGRAFAIMTDICAGILMLWSLARLFHNDLLLGSGRVVFILFYVLLLIFSLIFWILAFVAFSQRWCGASFTDDSNNKAGPCGPVVVSGWALAIVAFALELAYDGACENPAPHTVSNASSAHVMVPAATTVAAA